MYTNIHTGSLGLAGVARLKKSCCLFAGSSSTV